MKKMKSILIFILIISLCAGCATTSADDLSSAIRVDSSTDDSSENSDVTLSEEPVPNVGAAKETVGSRDNTSVCLVPSADAKVVYTCDVATIDASNVTEGYIMVSYFGTSPKVKLQIKGPNAITYTYNLTTGYEVFPLSSDSGSYNIAVYENVTGNQYASAMSQTLDINITNTFGPYLYPNQYVTFDSNSVAVAKAKELALSANNDLDVVSNVYNYVIKNVTYDYDKASNVKSGYIPDVDNILAIGTGICLDYAALMTSMLRSQNIPTRLEVGYAGEAYHAWISTYITDIGWVNGIIQFDGTSWELMDPTFAANSSEKSLKDFIGNGSNYTTKYIY